MSTQLTLQDGTEFSIRYCASNRPVIYGFQKSELEKLLATKDTDLVMFNGKEMPYAQASQQLGPIAAYVPNPGDYLKISNIL